MGDWQERANRRRDVRQTAVPEIRPQSGSKKDTKKWCRGVVGREHTPTCEKYNELHRTNLAPKWRVLVCSTCGKHLDYWWPMSWHHADKVPPAWVDK